MRITVPTACTTCVECFHLLSGTTRQRLLLARDRFGKKPLHYALHRGRLLFGSEIKSLLAGAPELADVDPQGVLNFFYFGYIQDRFLLSPKSRSCLPAICWSFRPAILRCTSIGTSPSTASMNRNLRKSACKNLNAASPRRCGFV